MSDQALDVLRTIDLAEDYLAMGAGPLVARRHRRAASVPLSNHYVFDLLGEATETLHERSGRPKNKRKRRAARAARRRNRR